MKKRKQYDDKFRASAVVMLEAAGYPEQKGALTYVAEHLSVPAMTLSRWFKRANNPPPNELVTEKRRDIVATLRTIAFKLADAIPDKIDDANLQQAGTVLGIVLDKLQLLEGKATERLEINELSDEERAARIAGLLGAARARRDGRASDDHAGGSE